MIRSQQSFMALTSDPQLRKSYPSWKYAFIFSMLQVVPANFPCL